MSPSPHPDSSHRRTCTLLLGIYGATGFATLVYQMAWTRQLIAMVGSALGAVSIMLAVLMGGFALGAWLERRRSDRDARPVRSLAYFLLLSAAAGAPTLLLDRIVSVDRMHAWLPTLSPDAAAMFTLLLVLPLMLLPVSLAGATFPLLARLLTQYLPPMTAYGRILAVQTAGSLLGAVVAGFLLLPTLGVDLTIVFAATMSAMAGGILLARPETKRHVPVPPVAPSSHSGRRVRQVALIALACSGAATLIEEVAWTRELLLLFGSSVYATSLMLAAVLLGLGVGQWWGSRAPYDVDAGLRRSSRALAWAGVTALLSYSLVRMAPYVYTYAYMYLRGSLGAFAVVQMLVSIAIICLPAFLIGVASPALLRLASPQTASRGEQGGAAYAVNTAAAMLGSVVAGFALLPLLTAKGTVAVGALLQSGGAVAVALVVRRRGRREPLLVPTALALVASAALLATAKPADPLLNFRLVNTGLESAQTSLAADRAWVPVYFKDASQGRVVVYRLPDGAYTLKGSGMTEGAQAFTDAQTTEMLVRLPAAVVPHARRYLVVGLGTGSTTYTALNAPGSEHVTTVEINPAVLEASRFFVGDAIFADPRSDIRVSDARTFVAGIDEQFDVIVSEPSYPLSPFSAQLFSREFFELEKRRLTPEGSAVQWLPAYLLNKADLQMMLKTFATVFPNSHVWRTGTSEEDVIDYVVVGINGDMTVDPAEVEGRVRADGGSDFEFSYIAGPAEMQALVQDSAVPLNTDDRPLLEYRTPLRQIKALWRE